MRLWHKSNGFIIFSCLIFEVQFNYDTASNSLWNEKCCKLSEPTGVETFVPLAFVAAVGGVGFEDVAVSGFQFFQDGGFVDDTRSTVVSECAEKN